MKWLFGMLVAAALSLILSFGSARGATLPVVSDVVRPDFAAEIAAPDLSQNAIEKVSLEFSSNSSADLSAGLIAREDETAVKYSGSELNGVLLTWSGNEMNQDSLTARATEEKTDALRRATEQPFSSIVNEVPLPPSAWQILTGILALGLFTRRTPTLAPQKIYRGR